MIGRSSSGLVCTLAFHFREGVVARLQHSAVLFSFCSIQSLEVGMRMHLSSCRVLDYWRKLNFLRAIYSKAASFF